MTGRTFDRVFVRPPGRRYSGCVSDNPERTSVDLALALRQHADYVSILRESGIAVTELLPVHEYPDSCFLQDVALLTARTAVIGRFGEASRRGEERVLEKELNGLLPMRRIKEPGTLEGGDILVTDDSIFVGVSVRTNVEGVRQLSGHLSDARIIPVGTSTLHLMSACSYVSNRTIIVAPDCFDDLDVFSGYKLIKIPKEEMYAANVLYLGQGRVMVPSGYPKTEALLKESALEPTLIDNSEFRKCDGGLSCLSLPSYKTV